MKKFKINYKKITNKEIMKLKIKMQNLMKENRIQNKLQYYKNSHQQQKIKNNRNNSKNNNKRNNKKKNNNRKRMYLTFHQYLQVQLTQNILFHLNLLQTNLLNKKLKNIITNKNQNQMNKNRLRNNNNHKINKK